MIQDIQAIILPKIQQADLIVVITRLLVASICGAVIGLEREFSQKAAGVRANMIVCVTSCLFTLLSIFVAYNGERVVSDPGRIAAMIVSGVGFLGAGCIIKAGLTVSGITTAATIWVMAALGMMIGMGYILAGILLLIIMLLTLTGLTQIDRKFRRHYLIMEFSFELHDCKQFSQLYNYVVGTGIKIQKTNLTQDGHGTFKLEYLDFKTKVFQEAISQMVAKNIISKWELKSA